MIGNMERGMGESNEVKRRPVIGWPQLLIGLAVLIALGLAIDLNAESSTGEHRSLQEERLMAVLATEQERNRELKLTLTYVHSQDYPADYARNEAGMTLPQEKRIVPMPHPLPLTPTPLPTPVPVIIVPEEPWQAWWMLFFDSPPPTR